MIRLPTIEHVPGLAERLAADVVCAERVTVKAVVQRGGQLWLLHSLVWDCYKFPGGGVEGSESYADTLARELREEAGAELRGVGPQLLTVTELSAAQEKEADVFRMTSHYYACELGTNWRAPQPEAYEQALGLVPVWVTPGTAAQANALALARPGAPRWLRRELKVLRALAGQL
ncbi:NUDIX domain-containing protein [Deinococcus sp. Marseille-Q6407]|uniref:NUDIX domain-containing protein n=1 Tax=Deinococcus sp. Marseille-Q6407 TaxID=2969223 RepID=UPI0021BFB859|nr:NUDIX domain-containing protein [Deinococcus sp. Marseille-Q6407]